MTNKSITADDIYRMALHHLGMVDNTAARGAFDMFYPTVEILTDGNLSNPATADYLGKRMAIEMCIPLTGDQYKYIKLRKLLNDK